MSFTRCLGRSLFVFIKKNLFGKNVSKDRKEESTANYEKDQEKTGGKKQHHHPLFIHANFHVLQDFLP